MPSLPTPSVAIGPVLVIVMSPPKVEARMPVALSPLVAIVPLVIVVSPDWE